MDKKELEKEIEEAAKVVKEAAKEMDDIRGSLSEGLGGDAGDQFVGKLGLVVDETDRAGSDLEQILEEIRRKG